MSDKYHALNLKNARAATPAVNAVEAMRRQLALAVFNDTNEADVSGMVAKLKEMAAAGDLKAMKMYFDLLLPKEQPPAPPASPANADGMKALANSIRDLVDEVRIAEAHSGKPTELLGVNGAADDEDDDEQGELMSETLDKDYMRSELRALDAEALYERTKSLIRMGNQYGMSKLDWVWRDLLRLEWQRRGNQARYDAALAEVQREKDEEREANLRACKEVVDKRFRHGEATP